MAVRTFLNCLLCLTTARIHRRSLGLTGEWSERNRLLFVVIACDHRAKTVEFERAAFSVTTNTLAKSSKGGFT